ncbi:MAG: GNAT family N-acetyltransferase [Sphingomonadaceae bacterium]
MAPAEDIDRLMLVMEAAFDPLFREAWSRKQVEDSLLVGNTRYGLVAASGKRPKPGEEAAGFYLSRAATDEEELLLFAVVPKHRGRGLGRILLDELFEDAAMRGIRKVFLEMRANNPAKSTYMNYGFSPIGQRPQYYRTTTGDWIDAITFAKSV